MPIISDWWDGLDTLFEPGKEILVARSPDDTIRYLRETSEAERKAIGRRARQRVLADHTAAHRAAEVEAHAYAAKGAHGAATAASRTNPT